MITKKHKLQQHSNNNSSSSSVARYCESLLANTGDFSSLPFSDIIVQTVANRFPLHRIFLIKSTYFESILTGPWAESGNKEIDLREAELAVLQAIISDGGTLEESNIAEQVWIGLFQYIYTNELNEIDEWDMSQLITLFHLFKFLNLNVRHITDQMENQIKKYLLITYMNGEVTSDERDFIEFLTRVTYLRLKRKSNFLNVPITLMKQLVENDQIPLETETTILYLWIKANLNRDSKKDISIRHLDEAKEIFELVDSIDLHILQDLTPVQRLNLFTNEALEQARTWRSTEATKAHAAGSVVTSEYFQDVYAYVDFVQTVDTLDEQVMIHLVYIYIRTLL